MKLGLRSKLIIAFVVVVVLPLIITASLVIVYANKVQENSTALTAMERVNNEIVSKVKANYNTIGREDFHKEIGPLLQAYDLTLEVIDVSDKVLYNSQDYLKPNEGNQEEFLMGLGNDLLRFQTPIYRQGIKVAKTVVKWHSSTPLFNFFNEIITKIFLSFLLGISSLVLLIVLFTWVISRSVLRPLTELNAATENIAKGNLDYRITYDRNDELGRFCKAFESMRVQLKESLARQEAYDRSRTEMVASISHDLRTPIASIVGYVEGLQDGVVTDEAMHQRYLNVIKEKTKQLDHLIEDLFQFSQLEIGELQTNLNLENSEKLLEKILRNYEDEFKGSPIIFRVERPLPQVMINVDQHRIEQVLANLVENAKRYMEGDGYIRMASEVKNNSLIVSVKDNGVGISEKDLPHIFERFYRGDKSRSREHGGTGQGLAICKFIIEAHGGQIWAESTLGSGTIIYLSLPIHETKAVKEAVTNRVDH